MTLANINAAAKIDTKVIDGEPANDVPADFESAMDIAGFGLFNVLLLIVAVFGVMSTIFETSVISYILPSAECDLKLGLFDKGLVNAMTYFGMISSALFWGYTADTKGRKKILIIGFLLNGVFVIGSATSQNSLQLMIFKYFSGFVLSGPFAILMSYLSELHCKKYRPSVMMLTGMMFSLSALLLPVLALTILPNNWTFYIFDLKFRAWQVFLAVCAIPSLLSGFLLILFPESPKFLMSQGRNDEAMQVFQKIYAMNNLRESGIYPVKSLVNELQNTTYVSTIEANSTVANNKVMEKKNAFEKILMQLRPIFLKPYLTLSLKFCFMNFCILLGQNTMRLWLPQLFASINEYEIVVGEANNMCDILDYSLNKTALLNEIPIENCQVVISADVYTNNIVVACMGLCGYIIVSCIVNAFDVKLILNFSVLIAGFCGMGLYWSASALTTVLICAVYTTTGSIACTSLISSSVNLFPTSLRTIIVSLAMMTGRLGAIIGNLLFPQFIVIGCIPPFLLVSLIMLVAFVVSLFLPRTNKESLK